MTQTDDDGAVDRQWISGPRADAWPAMVRAHARIVGQLSRNLEAAGQLSLGTYEVLNQLMRSGGQLRLRDLVQRVVLSQPGLSRKVDRMSQLGLVDREPDPHDGRGVLVTVTEKGRLAAREVDALHREGVEREFTAHIDEDEARVLVRVFDRLADHRLADPEDTGPSR